MIPLKEFNIKEIIFSLIDSYGFKGILIFIVLSLIIFFCWILYRYLRTKNIIKPIGIEKKIEDMNKNIIKNIDGLKKEVSDIKDLFK